MTPMKCRVSKTSRRYLDKSLDRHQRHSVTTILPIYTADHKIMALWLWR